MFQKLTDVLIKYDIDYASYLIIHDIYYGESIFEKYFLANESKLVRNNIERGTLTNVYILLDNGIIQKPTPFTKATCSTITLDKYYKTFKLTDKAIKIINEIERFTINNPIKQKLINKDTNVEEWIDEYRYLWSNNGRMLKQNALGNKQICISKMQEFIRQYPEYDKEIILTASKKYIEDYTLEHSGDFTYLVTAPYFIKREREPNQSKVESNTMRLSDYCELIIKNNLIIDDKLPSYGQGELA